MVSSPPTGRDDDGPDPDGSPREARRPLLFVTAAAIEAAVLQRALQGPLARSPAEAVQSPVLVAGVGRGGDATVAAALAGIDAARDAPPDGLAIDRPRALGTIVAVGLAGGLAPGIEAGEVVLTECWRGAQPPHGDGPRASRRALDAVAGLLRDAGITARRGSGVTVDAPFHDAAARDRLHAATGALTVEMEGARWASMAAAAGVDFVSVRVISDRADLRLPRPRHELLEATGEVRWQAWRAALRTAPTIPARDRADDLRDLEVARREWIAAMHALQRVGAALAGMLR